MSSHTPGMLTLSFISCLILLVALSSPAYAKRIVISIDGTQNDPKDGVDDYDEFRVLKDQSITNVLKLHLLAGGTLNNKSQRDREQICLYYVGVGNRARKAFYAELSAALAIREPKEIIAEAIQDLEHHYEPGDTLYLFGFSRGAAIARILAQQLNDNGITVERKKLNPTVTFLGVWDTVAALNGPNMDIDLLPSSTDLNEREGAIAGNVEQAYHLLSIDDPRIAFRPTLMGAEDRVQEVWFAGVHSDVGGGYKSDGLSDITLEFMIARAKEAENPSMKFWHPSEIIEELQEIDPDRVTIKSNPLGVIHLSPVKDEKYKHWLAKWTDIFADRTIYISEQEPTGRLPLIHHTVFDRRDETGVRYDPRNVRALNKNYQILQSDGTIVRPH